MFLKKKMNPKYIIDEIEISSYSDREDFDEGNSDKETSDEKSSDEKIQMKKIKK